MEAGALVGFGQCLVEEFLLGGLFRGNPEFTFGTGQALELLPVAGDLQQCQYRVGRLCAHAQPVLGPLGVDADQRGVFFGLVDANVFDDFAVTAGAGVGDHDTVLGVADFA